MPKVRLSASAGLVARAYPKWGTMLRAQGPDTKSNIGTRLPLTLPVQAANSLRLAGLAGGAFLGRGA